MAEVRARFSLIDAISEKLSAIADAGRSMMDNFSDVEDKASSALDGIASSSSGVVNAIEGIAKSVDNLDNTANTAKTAAEDLAETIDSIDGASTDGIVGGVEELENALEEADNAAGAAGAAADELASAMENAENAVRQSADSTDYWTAKASSFDKSALEAIYSLEELVDMGLKSADALQEQEAMFRLCEQSAGQLASALDATTSAHDELASSIQQSESAMESLGDNTRISAEAQEQLDAAAQAAAQAMQELEAAQADAEAAMQEYDSVMTSGTNDLAELEAAAERAGTASEVLAEANYNASNAAENLAKATENASKSVESAAESTENGSQKMLDSMNALAETAIAAKIADEVKQITAAVYEMVEAFSEAEKVVVNATGATGDALDGLEVSMTSAYAAHHQDLNTTAGAIGEINTRMHLTGQELSDVTGLFLDFNSITGSDTVRSIQNVTKVMNKWGVEQENVESVLDKLAYAGQISGASVDSLSQTLITGAASFQQLDLSLDSTISMLAELELYGMNSTTVITAMRTAVKNFSNDGIDASEGLRQTIEEISNLESAADATALSCEVFGARAGVDMANAIRSGAISVDTLTGSLEEAAGTLRTTAEASETLGEKWDKTGNKFKAAFTTAIEPTLTKTSTELANIAGRVGDFLNEHPVITKMLTAVGVGLGAAAIGVAAIGVASLQSIPAVAAFGTALHAALGPIGIIAGIATVAAAGILLMSDAFSETEEQIEAYDGTMEQLQYELGKTEMAYEKACSMYGENSAAALELSDRLTTLNKQYEAGGGAIAVYAEKSEKLSESYSELSKSQQKAMDSIDKSQTSGLVAVAMLQSLSEQSTHTSADLEMMGQYADYLNNDFDCNIKVNYDTGDITGFDPTKASAAVYAAAKEAERKQAEEYLTNPDFINTYTEARRQVAELESQLNGLYNEPKKIDVQPNGDNLHDMFTSTYEVDRPTEEINADIESVQASLSQYREVLQGCEADLEKYGGILDETGAFTKNYADILDNAAFSTGNVNDVTANLRNTLSDEETGIQAVNELWDQQTVAIEALAEAYQEAYDAAYESIHGQFGLFDEASTKSEEYMNSTVANAQKALESQLSYWTTYGENIETLKNTSYSDLGVTEENWNAIMAFAQDGSEQAAGLAASMVEAINSGDAEAVATLANTYAEVTSKQSEITASVADWQTGFSTQMDAILATMNGTIADLDMSSEANAAATSTMTSYANAITSAGANAVAAARSIASQVSAALSAANTTINIGVNGSIPGHASGTTNAEDVFVAGENGPELVVGKSGSTVFPASETNRIIAALHGIDGTSYGDTYNTTANNHAEVVNNYTTVENNSSYDDERILYLLSGFVSMLSSIEGKMEQNRGQDTTAITVDAYENGTTDSADTFVAGENGPELIIGEPDSKVFPVEETERIITAINGTDITGALATVVKEIQPTGDEISNFDQSITYGDTPDYSHEYTTDYGDRIYNAADSFSDDHSSLTNTEATTYEDNSRRLSTALSEGDSAYTENNTASSYGTAYETAVRYGDTIRNAENATVYYVNNSESTISGDQSHEVGGSFTDSRTYFAESADSTINTPEIVTNNSRTVEATTSYGDTIQNRTEIPMKSEDSAHSAEDASYAVFIPMMALLEAFAQKALSDKLSVSQGYDLLPNDELEGITDNSDIVSDSNSYVMTGIEMPEQDFVYGDHEIKISEPDIAEPVQSIIPISEESSVIGEESLENEISQQTGSKQISESKEDSTKRIVIEINGSGEIDVSGGIDRDEVLEILQDHMKPVLMNIIQTEMYEEGDGSYDF